MALVPLIKRKLGSVSAVHILLAGIFLVLLFGLFKREITVWKAVNWPGLRQKDVIVNYPCQKEIINPDYTKAFTDYLEKCPINVGDAEEGLLDIILRRQKCAYEKEWPPRNISLDSICQKTVSETWFYALGRYWFSINQLKAWMFGGTIQTIDFNSN